MEVIKEFDNKLLDRKEIMVNIETDGPTLKREEIKKEIAKKFKVEESNVVIIKVHTKFGSRTVDVSANLYENAEILKRLTPKYLIKRNGLEEPAGEATEE